MIVGTASPAIGGAERQRDAIQKIAPRDFAAHA